MRTEALETLETSLPAQRTFVLSHEGAQPISFGDASITIKTRASASSASVAEFLAPPGSMAPLHVHHDSDETFYVLEGEVALWCNDHTTHARAGDFVALPAGAPHSIRVEGTQPLRLLLIQSNNQFLEFVEEVAATGPFNPHTVAAAATRHGQTILGPSPFDPATRP